MFADASAGDFSDVMFETNTAGTQGGALRYRSGSIGTASGCAPTS